MYCRNCGKQIPDGAKFCPRCGKPTAAAVPESAAAPAAPKKSRAPLVIAVVALVLVLAAGGAAAWYFLGRPAGKTADTAEDAPAVTVQAQPGGGPAAEVPAVEETPAPTPEPARPGKVFGGGFGRSRAARVGDTVLVSRPVDDPARAGDSILSVLQLNGEGAFELSGESIPGKYDCLVPWQEAVWAIEYETGAASIVRIDPDSLEKTALLSLTDDAFLNGLYTGQGKLYFGRTEGDGRGVWHLETDGTPIRDFDLAGAETVFGVSERGVYVGAWDENADMRLRLVSFSGETLTELPPFESAFDLIAEREDWLYAQVYDGNNMCHLMRYDLSTGAGEDVTGLLLQGGLDLNAVSGSNFWDADEDGFCLMICDYTDNSVQVVRIDPEQFFSETVYSGPAELAATAAWTGEVYLLGNGQMLTRYVDRGAATDVLTLH